MQVTNLIICSSGCVLEENILNTNCTKTVHGCISVEHKSSQDGNATCDTCSSELTAVSHMSSICEHSASEKEPLLGTKLMVKNSIRPIESKSDSILGKRSQQLPMDQTTCNKLQKAELYTVNTLQDECTQVNICDSSSASPKYS